MGGTVEAALPVQLPVFPLAGALMLPRAHLPLNIFEPRYLAMVRDAMAGHRMIGMVQPKEVAVRPALFEVGGVGRITQFAETDDGRYLIVLTGVSRFKILNELEVSTPYRQTIVRYDCFPSDREPQPALTRALRKRLEDRLKAYLESQDLSADWDSIRKADDESLINTLSGVCPFDPIERQALLEAPALADRADTLIALMEFATPMGDLPPSKLQ
jgi:Lon protease-like protein